MPNCCHGNGFKGVIMFLLWCTFMVPSFKNTASKFLEISFIKYFTILVANNIWRHHWSNLYNRKTSISLKRKKIFQKEKRHSSVFWKAFEISRKCFSRHMHFKLNEWMNEWMCIYIPHISHIVSRRLAILIEWDRTSACKVVLFKFRGLWKQYSLILWSPRTVENSGILDISLHSS